MDNVHRKYGFKIRVFRIGYISCWGICLFFATVACHPEKTKEVGKQVQDIINNHTSQDSIEVDELISIRDTTDIELNQTAVPYVSLLAQRDQAEEEVQIGELIQEGAKEFYVSNLNTSLNPMWPVAPQAYRDLSFFAYLEDLVRFKHYLANNAHTIDGSKNKVTWPKDFQLPEPDHKILEYPVVRQNYLSSYCPGCYNPTYLPLESEMVDPLKVQDQRYRPLLELYTMIFEPSLRNDLEKDFIAFAYEAIGQEDRRKRAARSASYALAQQFNQRAHLEISTEKQMQADRMEQLYGDLKQARRNDKQAVLEKSLNEILKLQAVLLEPVPIQNDIVRFFEELNAKAGLPENLQVKVDRLQSYRQVASDDSRVLSGPAMSFAQKALQAKPLTAAELNTIQETLDAAKRKIATLVAEKETLKAQLTKYNSILTNEERTFFTLYQRSFQYHINVWDRFVLQLQELLDVPLEDSSFSYLLLKDRAVKERDKALSNNPFVASAKDKLRKLAGYYYQEVREQGEAFKSLQSTQK